MQRLLETLQQSIITPETALPRTFLKPKAQLSTKKQIKIYASAYRNRLRSILQEDYPLLQKQIGKRQFRSLAHDFIAKNPPQLTDLGAYSRSFAAHLRQKHNQISPEALRTAALEAAELQLLEMESTPPFHPAPTTSMEQLLAFSLKPQTASLFTEGQFIYRVGSHILSESMTTQTFQTLQKLKNNTLQGWLETLPPTIAAQAPGWLMHWLAHSMLCEQSPAP